MKKRSKKERAEYLKKLRKRWAESKVLAEKDEIAKALYREAGLNISFYNFAFVLSQMKAQGLEGLPYIHAKTFKKWRELGYKVKKGEESKLDGITWISTTEKRGQEDTKTEGIEEEVEEGYRFPKLYHLFHESQVEAIERRD